MLINYESFIPNKSVLVGKRIKDVESECELKIDHYHNSPVATETKQVCPNPDTILRPGMYIKICDAGPEKLANFRQRYNLP